MKNEQFIFKSNGNYLGFIIDSYLYSRDGEFLGWLEGNSIWDKTGIYRGKLQEIDGNWYITHNQYAVPPLPKSFKVIPNITNLPDPKPNIVPISFAIGYEDAFK